MINTDVLRAEIIATALQMNALRINQGKAGNVSARVTQHFLITPSGIPYDQLEAADVALMPLGASDERDATGSWLPSSEWRFHRDIYVARSEAGAIVHTHGVYSTTLACLGRGIPAFHYMVAAAGGNDIRCAPYATFGTQQLSDQALAALDGRSACLLAQHGLIAFGRTLERALALALEVETLAQMY